MKSLKKKEVLKIQKKKRIRKSKKKMMVILGETVQVVSKAPSVARIYNNPSTMSLDEMLEASRIIDIGIMGEKIPTIKSPKVQKYVKKVLNLNKLKSTRPIAKRMQQNLDDQIIKKNRRTTNPVEATKLYKTLMSENVLVPDPGKKR